LGLLVLLASDNYWYHTSLEKLPNYALGVPHYADDCTATSVITAYDFASALLCMLVSNKVKFGTTGLLVFHLTTVTCFLWCVWMSSECVDVVTAYSG